MKKFIEVNFPDEMNGKSIEEVDLIGWINKELSQGRVFHCFIPSGFGGIKSALFLIDDK